MMPGTESSQVLERVLTPLADRLQVMEIQPPGLYAAVAVLVNVRAAGFISEIEPMLEYCGDGMPFMGEIQFQLPCFNMSRDRRLTLF